MRILKKLAFAALLAAISTTVPATVYRVSVDGTDTNPGTEAAPFRTVMKGMTVAMPGDTVLLGPGSYPEVIESKRAGTAEGRITLDGGGKASALGLSFSHPYVTVANLSLGGAPFRTVYFNRGANFTVLSNSVVDSKMAQGVYGITWRSPSAKPFSDDAASNVLIISNRITGILGATVLNIYGDFNRIVGNYVHDMGQADFVRMWGRSNLISGNVFTNIYPVDGIGNHIDFIQTFGDNGYGSMHHVVEYNLVTDIQIGQLSQLTQDAIPEIHDWTFRNNVFARIASAATASVPYTRFYNNTFYRCNYLNGGHVLTVGGRTKPDPAESYFAHNSQVINNVFLACGNNSKDILGWYMFLPNLTNCVADYNYVANEFYGPKKAGTVPIGTDSDGDGAGDWSVFAFYELHGINGGVPKFVDDKNLNFRLRVGSPLIGVGFPLNSNFTTDMAGRPRGLKWDIGAYEFQDGEVLLPPAAPRGLTLQVLPAR